MSRQAGQVDFRHDINGLRAWAVIAVVLYHFGVPGFGGGFAGVDVFFVISGYLMYGIIWRGLAAERFSLWAFYLARARRIWPALAVLCIVMLAFGWFFLMPQEYQLLGKHVRESLLFSSNVEYFAEAGYFDQASKNKWLLHTWSLSVEWQFYLLLPLLMLLVYRIRPGGRWLLGIVLAGFLVSLGWCVWRSSIAPDEVFYLLHARAWEMLAGALVYHLGGKLKVADLPGRALEGLGLLLIVVAVAGFDSTDVWPGWRAMVPVLGTALVLLVAREQSIWTGNALASWIGTRSYSIYLWHWPLVVGLVYLDVQDQAIWLCAGIVASLLLGHLSYVWVEVPSRRMLSIQSPRRAACVVLAAVVILALCAQQVRRHGFPDRLPEAVANIEKASADKNPRSKECLVQEDTCLYGKGPVGAILLGDSHADHLVAGLRAGLPQAGTSVMFKGVAACFVSFGARGGQGRERCDALNQWLEAEHQTLPEGVPVILAGIYSAYTNQSKRSDKAVLFHFDPAAKTYNEAFFQSFREHYVRMSCELARHRPVYLVRPTPIMRQEVPQVMGRAVMLGKPLPSIGASREDYAQRHAFILQVQDEAVQTCGARLLDPLPWLCDENFCPGYRDGVPLYRDTSHLTERASRTLAPMFRQGLAF